MSIVEQHVRPADPTLADTSDVLRLTYAYDPPPASFDPGTAPDALLRRHGIPRRPDPETEPHLAALWRRAFTRPVEVVPAALAIDPTRAGRPRPPRRWAGVMRDLDQADVPATMASAQWIVPEVVTVDPATYADRTVTFWVGLGGGADLLRAGIAATVEPGQHPSRASYHAWTQWDTIDEDPAAIVTNLPIRAGDTVAVTVCVAEPSRGLIRLTNLTRNLGTSVGAQTRPGRTSAARAAAWIVEGVSADLPAFSPVAFTDCVASSMNEVFHLSPGGVTMNITGGSGGGEFGPRLTRTTITSPTTVVVGWNGFA